MRVCIARGELSDFFERGDGERRPLRERTDAHAADPLDRDLQGVAAGRDAVVDARQHADAPIQPDRVLGVLAQGDGEGDERARFGVRPEQGEIVGGAHLNGDGAVRKDDRRAEREQGELRWQGSVVGVGHVTQTSAETWYSPPWIHPAARLASKAHV